MQSEKWNLNQADWQRWIRNMLIFSSPTILAFLIALSGGLTLTVAKYMAYQAGLASLIDLFTKLRNG